MRKTPAAVMRRGGLVDFACGRTAEGFPAGINIGENAS